MQYVYVLNPVYRFNYSWHSRREVPRQADIVNPNTMTIHRTWHTLININNVKISTHCLGCLIFLHIMTLTSKSIRITPLKKCYCYCAGPAGYRMVLNRTFTVQNKPAAVALKETITHHFFVSGIGQKKTVDAAKNLWRRRKNVVKTETQQTFVNGLLGFITLGIYTSVGSACVLLTILWWVAHRYGQLYPPLINRLALPVVFEDKDQAFSEGEIISFSRSPVGGGCAFYPRRRRWWASRTDWQTALMCNWRRPAATSSRRASFSALAMANSFVYFASSAAHHADASACQYHVRQLQFSGIFVVLGFVGNGVITVTINSPWQADDDADNQSGDNRGDSAHTSISWPFRPLLWILQNQAVSLMLELTITSARQKPRYCRGNGRLPDGYHHDQS